MYEFVALLVRKVQREKGGEDEEEKKGSFCALLMIAMLCIKNLWFDFREI